MTSASEDNELAGKMLEAVNELIRGTEFAPPDGGLLVDCLVVMIHVEPDGEQGCTWLSAGSREAAEGMARRVIRSIDSYELAFLYHMLKGDHDD